jgi:NAD(P) transhydrogenase subunit beta
MSGKDVNNLADRISAVYVVCGLLFIFSFEKLSNRITSKRGNYYGIVAMILAIISTLFLDEIKTEFIKFLIPLIVGGILGIVSSALIKITRIPEYIAFTHSLIGICNVLLAFANFLDPSQLPKLDLIIITFDIFIGMLTFSGSFVAFLKFLNIFDKPIYILGCGRHLLNLFLICGVITLSTLFLYNSTIIYLIIIAGISLILGINLVFMS